MLPINKQEDEIIKLVKSNKISLIIGDTGCGKSTQISQILMKHKMVSRMTIVQPRRVAAMSLAMRVSEELKSKLGETVGQNVRFNRKLSQQTQVIFQTDGMLIKEQISDITLSKYNIIVIDEVHERNTNTDLLIALTQDHIIKRDDVKIIFMSATVDTDSLASKLKLPSKAIMNIKHKSHPNIVCQLNDYKYDSINIVSQAIDTVLQIHLKFRNELGDILVFLPGQNEIESAVDSIMKVSSKLNINNLTLKAFPLFSNLIYEKQLEVFKPLESQYRKVVFATNIAETSITIAGIRFVVDSGLVKQKLNKSLVTKKCCKISAIQRRGRSGRDVEGGIVFRLQREDDYKDNFNLQEKPSIFIEDLDAMVLNLKAMNISNVINMSWIDKPSNERWQKALNNLRSLKAIDGKNLITEDGLKMAKIPLEPEVSKLLIASYYASCAQEMSIIVSLFEANNLFQFDDKKTSDASGIKMFSSNSGDHQSLQLIMKGFIDQKLSKKWCKSNNLSQTNLLNSQQIATQIQDLVMNLCSNSNFDKFDKISIENELESERRVIKCLAESLPYKVCVREEKKGSSKQFTLDETHKVLQIHPKSSMFNRRPDFIIYNDINVSTKAQLNVVSRIDENDLKDNIKNKLNHLRIK